MVSAAGMEPEVTVAQELVQAGDHRGISPQFVLGVPGVLLQLTFAFLPSGDRLAAPLEQPFAGLLLVGRLGGGGGAALAADGPSDSNGTAPMASSRMKRETRDRMGSSNLRFTAILSRGPRAGTGLLLVAAKQDFLPFRTEQKSQSQLGHRQQDLKIDAPNRLRRQAAAETEAAAPP